MPHKKKKKKESEGKEFVKECLGDLYEPFINHLKNKISERLPVYKGTKYCQRYLETHEQKCKGLIRDEEGRYTKKKFECESNEGCSHLDFFIPVAYSFIVSADIPSEKIESGEFLEIGTSPSVNVSYVIDRIISYHQTLDEKSRKNRNLMSLLKKLNK